MYNQELNRDEIAPSYQKLRTMVRQHIDQTIRTRNFRGRNKTFQTGVFVKSRKGRNVSAERKVPRLTEGSFLKCSPRGVSPSGLKGERPFKINSEREGPELQSLNPDASMVAVVISDILRLMGKSKKCGGKGSIFKWVVRR